MKKKSQLLSVFSLLLLFSCKTTSDFPVSEWNSDSNKPIIFYISGDAGFNTFSKTFAQELHHYGYDVFALNSKKYFWDKKTPLQASEDSENFLK